MANEVSTFIGNTTREFDEFAQKRQNDAAFNIEFVNAINSKDLATAQRLLSVGGISNPQSLKLSSRGDAAPQPEWSHCFGKGHWYQLCVTIVISVSTDPPSK